MNTPVSARKPYQPKLSRSWWLKHNYYRLYMLREATVLPLLFFIGCLLYGLYYLCCLYYLSGLFGRCCPCCRVRR